MAKKKIIRRFVFFPWYRKKRRLRKVLPGAEKSTKAITSEQSEDLAPLTYIPAEVDPYAKMLKELPHILTSLPPAAIPTTQHKSQQDKYAWGLAVHLSYQAYKFGRKPLPSTH